MQKKLAIFFLVLFLFNEISSKDMLLLYIKDFYIIRNFSITWDLLRIDIVQPGQLENQEVYTLRDENIDINKMDQHFTKYYEKIQRGSKLSFIFVTNDVNARVKNTIFIEINNSESCQMAENIYIIFHDKSRLEIEIDYKLCIIRDIIDTKQEIKEIENFMKLKPPSMNTTCEKSMYKFSPQLKRQICLCRYGSYCPTYTDCFFNGYQCSDRGFCEKEKSKNNCLCVSPYYGPYCQFVKTTCELLSPCFNNATCINIEDDSFKCQCLRGFHGKLCEIPDHCVDNPCLNEGSCISMNGRFYCSCSAEYTGRNCELNLSKCPKCENGATCFTPDMGKNHFCKCLPGFIGHRCQTPAKKCETENHCLYEGSCFLNTKNEKKCFCPYIFNGRFCEKLSDCGNRCLNGGFCSLVVFNKTDLPTTETVCLCPYGFYGRFCEFAHFCVENLTPCKNRGTCLILNYDKYYCVCAPGFHGKNCEMKNCIKDTDCQNGGICVSGERVKCKCSPSYSGEFCQYKNECYNNIQCGTNGKCQTDVEGKFLKCKCNEGWLGKTCDIQIISRSEL